MDIAQDFEKDYPVYRSFLKIRTAISTVKKNDIKTKRIELLKIITLLVTVQVNCVKIFIVTNNTIAP